MANVLWQQGGLNHQALWRSERGEPAPAHVVLADDTMPANTAYRLACEGAGLLWQGDFNNARHLLQALVRRVDRAPRRLDLPAKHRAAASVGGESLLQIFQRHRVAQSQRARVLSMLLMPLQADYRIVLRRAPALQEACLQAWGPAPAALPGLATDASDRSVAHSVVSMRELLGVVSAFEWRKKGVAVAALGPPPNNRIHPHYGVFSPVRGEYVDLVARAPWPAAAKAGGTVFDIGTGTGVLAALLAQRAMAANPAVDVPIVATDVDLRALACAQENLLRLGLQQRVQVLAADLYPPGRAALVVCNPPWLPLRPGSALERAVYDEDSAMLRGFLQGLAEHLTPGGEGWLIMSDLAEHLGLRTRAQLLDWITVAGLHVLARLDTRPVHRKATDATDPLHQARAAEVTSLWRLGVR